MFADLDQHALNLGQALQRVGIGHDKAGEEHFNLISALLKSIRNSDANATVHWIVRMLHSGEDGNYLARAKKSNALYKAHGEAVQVVEQTAAEPVPLHLRNASTALTKEPGYGKGYRYAHDDPDAAAERTCLPPWLEGRRYSSSGAAPHQEHRRAPPAKRSPACLRGDRCSKSARRGEARVPWARMRYQDDREWGRAARLATWTRSDPQLETRLGLRMRACGTARAVWSRRGDPRHSERQLELWRRPSGLDRCRVGVECEVRADAPDDGAFGEE